ncbi:MAG: hypothetical protein ACYS4W_02820 [Planctomycetota bacterium]|jgi:hypothetical protein
MKKHTLDISSRREMLLAFLRYGVLAVLVAAGASAFVKRRRLEREGKCINGRACRDCSILDRCELPAALSAKRNSAGKGNEGQ